MYDLKTAREQDLTQIYELYKGAIQKVNQGTVKLGWNIEIYPDLAFMKEAVAKEQMLIFCEGEKLLACGVVNHSMIPEYEMISWRVSEPKEKIATIHALAADAESWGKGISSKFLQAILEYCRKRGDAALHLDVIDTNFPAERLYLRNGFEKVQEYPMLYESVGNRMFSMMEYVF